METNWLHDLAMESLGDFNVTDEIDFRLSALAARALTDSDAAWELLTLLAGKIKRSVWRFRSWDIAPFDLDDVAQESYLVFLETIRRWNPRYVEGRASGFSRYFLVVFPHRLARAVRKWRRPARAPVIRQVAPSIRALSDDETSVVIDFCRNLDPLEVKLLRLRLAGGLSVPGAADTLGLSRSTAYRRWRRIRRIGREYLREAG